MRIWFKMIVQNRIIQETVVENTEDISRTGKIFSCLETVCHDWDLAVPIWLDATIRDFQHHSRARFTDDNFPEHIDFDYLEIHVIEE